MNALGRIYLLKVKRYILKSYTLFFCYQNTTCNEPDFYQLCNKAILKHNSYLCNVLFHEKYDINKLYRIHKTKKSCYLSKVRIEYI